MATAETPHAPGNFEGFDEKDRELDGRRYHKRERLEESVMNELVVKFGKLEERTSILEAENLKMRVTQDELNKRCNLNSEELEMFKKKTGELEKENMLLKKENEKLASQVKANQESVKNNDENMREIKNLQKEWSKEKDEVKVNFRDIIESQKQDKENLTKAVICVYLPSCIYLVVCYGK